MRVFFGGSFDPVHLGHLLVARDLMEELGIKELVFLPASQSPLKEPHKASPEDRLEMLRLATQGLEGFSISTVELKRKGISYTVDTARTLIQELGERPTFLMGADSALTLHLWKEPDELIKIAKFIVIDRASKGNEVKTYLKERFPQLKKGEDYIIVSIRRVDISSTEVRQRVKEGRSIKWLVPQEVEEYILSKGLYRS